MTQLGDGGGSGYPAEVDTSTVEKNDPDPNATVVDADKTNDITDAVIKIQTELGLDPAQAKATLLAWLQQQHGTDGKHSKTFDTPLTVSAKLTLSKALITAQGADVESAASADIWALDDGTLIDITGTTQIDDFGTATQAGEFRIVQFDGILVLKNNTEIELPGGADITTAAGDIALIIAESTTISRVIYFRVSGLAITELEETKAWVTFNGATGSVDDSFNVTSVTDNNAGDFTINFTTNFANANYCVTGTARPTGAAISGFSIHQSVAPIVSALRIKAYQGVTFQDVDTVYVAALGDQ